MKNFKSIFVALVLILMVVSSCKKNDDPQPTTQNNNNNNSNPQTWTTKTLEFYTDGNTGSDIARLYVGEDQTNPTSRGSLMGFIRQKTSACIEPNTGLQVDITKTGRYYYESRRGLVSTGFTVTHAGYIDVANDGTVTLTQTTYPGGTQIMSYVDCSFPRFTVFYTDRPSNYND